MCNPGVKLFLSEQWIWNSNGCSMGMMSGIWLNIGETHGDRDICESEVCTCVEAGELKCKMTGPCKLFITSLCIKGTSRAGQMLPDIACETPW